MMCIPALARVTRAAGSNCVSAWPAMAVDIIDGIPFGDSARFRSFGVEHGWGL